MECERAEAAAFYVDLASWQRCLEGLFIASHLAALVEAHARQLRALLERLDVA